jgi:hypothetical protein
MAATGVLGARLFVGSVALVDIEAAADAIADFTALSAGLEVGLIENIGEFGKVFDLVTFQAVADGRTYKLKGGYNEGNLQMTVASDLTDAGQALLFAYGNAQDQNTYPFKITLVGVDAAFDTVYFGGKVFSYRQQLGTVNNIIRATVNIEINTPVFIGAN